MSGGRGMSGGGGVSGGGGGGWRAQGGGAAACAGHVWCPQRQGRAADQPGRTCIQQHGGGGPGRAGAPSASSQLRTRVYGRAWALAGRCSVWARALAAERRLASGSRWLKRVFYAATVAAGLATARSFCLLSCVCGSGLSVFACCRARRYSDRSPSCAEDDRRAASAEPAHPKCNRRVPCSCRADPHP